VAWSYDHFQLAALQINAWPLGRRRGKSFLVVYATRPEIVMIDLGYTMTSTGGVTATRGIPGNVRS